MAHCNENYLNLQGAYLFAEVRKKQEAYKAAHPDANIISLGIGDVTQPLAPVVIEAMKKAVEEMDNVSVGDVNTINYAGKKKSRYTKPGIINGKQAAFKKAIVTLKEGETIDFFSNI